jgi:hypothetical protein
MKRRVVALDKLSGGGTTFVRRKRFSPKRL